jgi:predicted membrane protein
LLVSISEVFSKLMKDEPFFHLIFNLGKLILNWKEEILQRNIIMIIIGTCKYFYLRELKSEIFCVFERFFFFFSKFKLKYLLSFQLTVPRVMSVVCLFIVFKKTYSLFLLHQMRKWNDELEACSKYSRSKILKNKSQLLANQIVFLSAKTISLMQ